MKKVIQSILALTSIMFVGMLGLRTVQEVERVDTLESACERAGARPGSVARAFRRAVSDTRWYTDS